MPAYIASVSKLSGYKPNQHLPLGDAQVLGKLLDAIFRVENRGQDPYAGAPLEHAVLTAEATKAPVYAGNAVTGAPAAQAPAVQVHVHVTAPPGTKAMVTDQKGNLLPAKVQYSMAHFALP